MRQRITVMTRLVKKSISAFAVAFAALSIVPLAQSNTANNILIGNVYDSKTGVELYTEQHQFLIKPESHTLQSRYFDQDDQLIGERKVEYQSNRVERYRLEQGHLGIAEEIERTPEGLYFSVTKDGQTKTKEITYKNPNEIVIDAGFDDFIVREWKRLMQGKTIKFPYASASQMDVVKLQIKRVDAKSQLLADAQKARFEMTTSNPLFRLVITPITIEYFTDTRELASYRGISNIKDSNRNNFDAYVEFERDAAFRKLANRAKSPESKISVVAN